MGGAESDKNPLVWAGEMRCCPGNGDLPTHSFGETRRPTIAPLPIVKGGGLDRITSSKRAEEK
jgi:hypothetical protein